MILLALPFLGAATLVDLKTKKIPNWIVVSGMICAFLLAASVSLESLGWALAGSLLGAVVMLPLYNWNFMGGGDVKLAALIGAITGFPVVLIAIGLGLALGAIVISVLQSVKIINKDTAVPFAPMLTAGTLGALLCSESLLNVYTRIFMSG